ncbi:RNA polymerase sigma factor [Sulfidibacter corallicola]|uniref:RNA polymerase sigma factor n=1 Tax=Sulfidibacter corallicola TaxID=2818388 RepID=A0A8A4TPA0_SULCO|nr:RNA polymerase sigma factor [Sulfidibacter corallicola]QTD51796.1 RNA polymerase sigma factor [Sulfidibacter corallicola]
MEHLLTGLPGSPEYPTLRDQLTLFYSEGYLHRFFRKRGCTHHECEDLTHEVFLRVCKSLNTLKKAGSVKSWVYTIARNVFADYLKSTKGKCTRDGESVKIVSLEAEDGPGSTDSLPERVAASRSPTPEEALLQGEEQAMKQHRLKLLKTAIEQLPTQRRHVILLRYYQQYSILEVAAIKKLSPGAVKATQSQAVQQLRERLGDEFQFDIDM